MRQDCGWREAGGTEEHGFGAGTPGFQPWPYQVHGQVTTSLYLSFLTYKMMLQDGLW